MLWRCVSVTPTEQRLTRTAPSTEAMHQFAWGAGVLDAGCERGVHVRARESLGIFFQHSACTVKLTSK